MWDNRVTGYKYNSVQQASEGTAGSARSMVRAARTRNHALVLNSKTRETAWTLELSSADTPRDTETDDRIVLAPSLTQLMLDPISFSLLLDFVRVPESVQHTTLRLGSLSPSRLVHE